MPSSLFVVFLLACGGGSEMPAAEPMPVPEAAPEPEEAAVPEIDWSNHGKMRGAVAVHVVATEDKNDGTYPVEDAETGETYDVDIKVQKPPAYPVSATQGRWLVDSETADGRAIVLDYLVEWNDAKDRFDVKEVGVQSLDGEVRYTYDKDGDFYAKVPAG